MRIIKIEPDADWRAIALVNSQHLLVCSIAVSYEHWEVETKDRLYYIGPSTSGRKWCVILGWLMFFMPMTPHVLKKEFQ